MSGSCWRRDENRDPSGGDSSSLVADGIVASLELWLGEQAVLPKRGGRGVRARSGDGGRERRGLSWSVSLCGDSCCLGLGVMEDAFPTCENREAHEDLLLAVAASLGVGDGVPVVAETRSGISCKSPRRGEEGVSASSVGAGESGVALSVVLSSLGDDPVDVVELELCDDRRVIVRVAWLPAAARGGRPVGVAVGAALEVLAVVGRSFMCCASCLLCLRMWLSSPFLVVMVAGHCGHLCLLRSRGDSSCLPLAMQEWSVGCSPRPVVEQRVQVYATFTLSSCSSSRCRTKLCRLLVQLIPEYRTPHLSMGQVKLCGIGKKTSRVCPSLPSWGWFWASRGLGAVGVPASPVFGGPTSSDITYWRANTSKDNRISTAGCTSL